MNVLFTLCNSDLIVGYYNTHYMIQIWLVKRANISVKKLFSLKYVLREVIAWEQQKSQEVNLALNTLCGL